MSVNSAVGAHEDAAVVDVGAAEIEVVLGKLVVRVLGRIHDHFRTHIAEQQIVAVGLAPVHEHLVADLACRAGEELVLERLAEQLGPRGVEGARQPFRAAALAGRNDDLKSLARIVFLGRGAADEGHPQGMSAADGNRPAEQRAARN